MLNVISKQAELFGAFYDDGEGEFFDAHEVAEGVDVGGVADIFQARDDFVEDEAAVGGVFFGAVELCAGDAKVVDQGAEAVVGETGYDAFGQHVTVEDDAAWGFGLMFIDCVKHESVIEFGVMSHER